MRKTRSARFIITLLSISFSFSVTTMASPTVSAKGAILIETKTNTILYEKNAYTKLYPASITKLMTALLVEENLSDDMPLSESEDSMDTVPSDSSNIGLKVGDMYDKSNALYGLLLGSDNYIAHDLAIATSGSISQFASEMNAKAAALGCKNTHFANPHGYHDPTHYTTPYDMALIAKAAFNNSKIQAIAGTVSFNFYITNQNKYLPIKNTSRLLKSETAYYNPHVVATKTGYHNDAGQTIVAKAVYGDMELIAVVMNTKTPEQYVDVNNLFDYANTNFSVNDLGGYYGLSNHTVPKWVQKSAAKAVKAGWVNPSQDYTDTLYTEDLVAMLKRSGSSYGGVTMIEVEKLTGLKAGDTLTISQLKKITDFAAKKWGKTAAPLNQTDFYRTATFAEAVSVIDRLIA